MHFAYMSFLPTFRLPSKGLREIPSQATLQLTTYPLSMVSVKVHLELSYLDRYHMQLVSSSVICVITQCQIIRF